MCCAGFAQWPGAAGTILAGVANDAEPGRPGRLIWQAEETGAVCDLSGHFWATIRQGKQDGHTAWSWMVIGYENQVLAAGQAGGLAAAKSLVEA